MAALFDIFTTIVIAMATAVFAHFGVMLAEADSAQSRSEATREVKRSPVIPGAEVVLATVSR